MNCKKSNSFCNFSKLILSEFGLVSNKINNSESLQEFVCFLCRSKVLKQKTMYKYLVVKVFSAVYHKNNFHKTNTVYDLAELFSVHENTIWSILRHNEFHNDEDNLKFEGSFKNKKIEKIIDEIYADIDNSYLQNEGNSEIRGSKIRVLYVEDKQINQKVAGMILRNMGCKVDFAENGLEALNIFKPGKYDLILMDICMPVMDGVQAFRLLKEKHKDDLPPVVVLTACASEEEADDFIKLGMNDFVSKPVTREKLSRVLIDNLDQSS